MILMNELIERVIIEIKDYNLEKEVSSILNDDWEDTLRNDGDYYQWEYLSLICQIFKRM